MKKFFLVAFVVSGLAFVPVQHSDAQIEIGIPGIWPKPGGSRGYPHFEYGYYPSGGWYYGSPFYGDYGGSSYHHHRHHYYHRNWGDQGHQGDQDEQ